MKKVLGAMAGILFAVFSLAVLGMLMTFTFGALKILFPDNFMNQMWGMVLFDIAAMIWALAFVFKSASVGQYAAAGIGFITAFAGTLLMVAADVILSGQTFVNDNSIGRWMVYGFIIVTAIHAALVYLHHASAPDIHQKINIGIAQGEITTEAIRQATATLDEQKAALAYHIHSGMVEQVKRDLNLPIAVDPNIGFVPAQTQVPYPVQTEPKEKKQSLVDRVKLRFMKPAKSQTIKNEQVVVDVPKLKTNAELRAKLEQNKGAYTPQQYALLLAQIDQDEELANSVDKAFPDTQKPKPIKWECNNCHSINEWERLICQGCSYSRDGNGHTIYQEEPKPGPDAPFQSGS